MHAAIEQKNTNIVQLLLSNWVIDVNIPLKKEIYKETYEYSGKHFIQKIITNNKEENPPLNIAVENECFEIISFLLEQDVNINDYSIINNFDHIYTQKPDNEPIKTYFKCKIISFF